MKTQEFRNIPVADVKETAGGEHFALNQIRQKMKELTDQKILKQKV